MNCAGIIPQVVVNCTMLPLLMWEWYHVDAGVDHEYSGVGSQNRETVGDHYGDTEQANQRRGIPGDG